MDYLVLFVGASASLYGLLSLVDMWKARMIFPPKPMDLIRIGIIFLLGQMLIILVCLIHIFKI